MWVNKDVRNGGKGVECVCVSVMSVRGYGEVRDRYG